MKYICDPKATWIRFQTEGVPLGQNLNNLYWEKCFAENKKNYLMHLYNFKKWFASEYGCPSEYKVNTAN